jgi:hypothetical protein
MGLKPVIIALSGDGSYVVTTSEMFLRNAAAGDMIISDSNLVGAASQSVKTCVRTMPTLPNMPHLTDFANAVTRLPAGV